MVDYKSMMTMTKKQKAASRHQHFPTHLVEHGFEVVTASQQSNAVCIEWPPFNLEYHVSKCLVVNILLPQVDTLLWLLRL